MHDSSVPQEVTKDSRWTPKAEENSAKSLVSFQTQNDGAISVLRQSEI